MRVFNFAGSSTSVIRGMAQLQLSQQTTTAEIEASNVTNLSPSSTLGSENGSVVSDSDVKEPVPEVDLAADERFAMFLARQEMESQRANPDEIVVMDRIGNDSSDDATSVSSDNAASNNTSLMDILAIIDDVEDVEQFLAAQRELLRTFSRDREDDEESDSDDYEGRHFWMQLMRSLSTPPEEQDNRIPEECQVTTQTPPTVQITVSEIDITDVSLKLEYNLGCSTRGNKYKLLNCTFCHDLRKYYFAAHIINIWNSLPNCIVNVSTINQFKARLDKFWMHQDVLYDYTADLTGIGDRSVKR